MGEFTPIKSRKKRRTNRIVRFLSVLLVVVLVVTQNINVTAALENDKSGSVRSVSMRDSQIEVATLVIGSHIIHINGLTSELYEVAMESANEFNQYQVYYKSELADGTWFEISDASSIADITSSGNPVNKSVVEALEFTHMTGSNGITIDLRTGQPVSIFDIGNPYDLSLMEELEPLRIQYQILQEKTNKNDSDNVYLEMIGHFFGKDIQDDTTRDLDVTLQSLENYKSGLSSRDKPAMWTEKTEGVMIAVDAERRVIALNKLAVYLDVLESNASGIEMTYEDEVKEDDEEAKEEEEVVEVPKDLIINSEIVGAVGECIQNVEESINAYEGKRLTNAGDTASAEAEYRHSQDLISRARSGNTSRCDSAVEALCNLQNIIDGMVVNQESELNTLTSELVSAAYTKYAGDLRAGISNDYRKAKAEGSSQAVLSKYLADQKAEANSDRLEYQMLLEAQFMRMDNAEAQEYTLKLIDGISQMEQSVLSDAAESYLKETVQDHLAWLKKMYAELVKDSVNSSEMDKLEQEKAALAKQRQDALDRNDLATANRLAAEMEAKQKDMDMLADSLNAILSSPNSSEADKAKARAGLGSKNTSALLASMADNLASAIRSGEDSDFEAQMLALSAAAQLDPSAGKNALDQVQSALDNATGLDADTAALIGDALTEAKDVLDELEASLGSDLSADGFADRLDSIMEDMFGVGFDEATAEQQAAAILALTMLDSDEDSEGGGNSAALDLAASLIKKMGLNGNSYTYEQYTGTADGYLSLKVLSKAIGYRYIFDDAHNTVMLQKAKEYYLFSLGQKEYESAGGSKGTLDKATKSMDGLYIHRDDSQKMFGVDTIYIVNTPYGVIITSSVESLAEDIYNELTEGGS